MKLKINYNNQEYDLKELVSTYQMLGFDINYNSIKSIKTRTIKQGKDSFKYKFLYFENVFDKWYCRIIN